LLLLAAVAGLCRLVNLVHEAALAVAALAVRTVVLGF
jgi:hypothetical protein